MQDPADVYLDRLLNESTQRKKAEQDVSTTRQKYIGTATSPAVEKTADDYLDSLLGEKPKAPAVQPKVLVKNTPTDVDQTAAEFERNKAAKRYDLLPPLQAKLSAAGWEVGSDYIKPPAAEPGAFPRWEASLTGVGEPPKAPAKATEKTYAYPHHNLPDIGLSVDLATRPFQYLSTMAAGAQRRIGASIGAIGGSNAASKALQSYGLTDILDAAAERFYTGRTRPGYEQPVGELYKLAVEKYGGDPDAAVHRVIEETLAGATDPVNFIAPEAVAERLGLVKAGKSVPFSKTAAKAGVLQRLEPEAQLGTAVTGKTLTKRVGPFPEATLTRSRPITPEPVVDIPPAQPATNATVITVRTPGSGRTRGQIGIVRVEPDGTATFERVGRAKGEPRPQTDLHIPQDEFEGLFTDKPEGFAPGVLEANRQRFIQEQAAARTTTPHHSQFQPRTEEGVFAPGEPKGYQEAKAAPAAAPVVEPTPGPLQTDKPQRILTDMSDEQVVELYHRLRAGYAKHPSPGLDARIELIGNELAARAQLPEGTAWGTRGDRVEPTVELTAQAAPPGQTHPVRDPAQLVADAQDKSTHGQMLLPEEEAAMREAGLTVPTYREPTPTVPTASVPSPMERVLGERAEPPPPTEPTLEPERVTSIKNAVTEAERAERGLPPVETIPRETPAEIAGRAMVDNDPIFRARVEALANDPKPVDDVMGHALLYDRTKLHNEHKSILNQIDAAIQAGDQQTAEYLKPKLLELEDQLNTNEIANKHTGTIWGRFGVARQAMMREDYSLATLVQKARVASGQAVIPDAVRAKLTDLSKQIETLSDRLAAAESRKPGLARPATHPGVLARLDQAAADARGRIATRRVAGERGSIGEQPVGPEGLPGGADALADYAIIGAAKLARLGADAAQWSAEMLHEFGDTIRPFLEQIYATSRQHVEAAQAGKLAGYKRALVKQIKDLETGVPKVEGMKLLLDEEAKGLQQRLAGLRAEGRAGSRLERYKKGLRKRIENVGEPRAATTPLEMDAEAQALQAELADARRTYAATPEAVRARQEKALTRYKAQLEQRINKIEGQVAAGRIEPSVQRGSPFADDPEVLKLKEQLGEAQAAARLVIDKQDPLYWLKKAGREGLGVLNFPRALKASLDISAPGRQGLWFGLTHPEIARRAFVEQIRALGMSKADFAAYNEAMKADPEFLRSQRLGGIEYTGMGDRLGMHEEPYMTGWLGNAPLIRHSEQAYSTFLNQQRLQMWKLYANELENPGRFARALGVKPVTAATDPAAFKAIGDFINKGTGRGDLGRLTQAAPILNSVLFAPRWVASRMQLINPWEYIKPQSRGVRVLKMKEALKFASIVGTTLYLAKQAGAEASTDPDSPDFLKIKVGNTRYDISGGFQQELKFLFKAARTIDRGARGKLVKDTRVEGHTVKGDPDLFDVVRDYVRNKLSPPAAVVADVGTGQMRKWGKETPTQGREQPLKPTFGRELEQLLIPMVMNDLREAYQLEGPKGLVKATPSVVGIGVNTYRTNPPSPSKTVRELIRQQQ